jgi:hypothetical protein
LQPILSAMELIAADSDGCASRCSNTIRTARARTSVEYRLCGPGMPHPPTFGVSGKSGAVQVLVPRAIRRVRLGFPPQLELVEILGGDQTIGDTIEEMLAETRWKIGPPNPRHQPPNVIRASSSFKRSRSAALVSNSVAGRPRAAAHPQIPACPREPVAYLDRHVGPPLLCARFA